MHDPLGTHDCSERDRCQLTRTCHSSRVRRSDGHEPSYLCLLCRSETFDDSSLQCPVVMHAPPPGVEPRPQYAVLLTTRQCRLSARVEIEEQAPNPLRRLASGAPHMSGHCRPMIPWCDSLNGSDVLDFCWIAYKPLAHDPPMSHIDCEYEHRFSTCLFLRNHGASPTDESAPRHHEKPLACLNTPCVGSEPCFEARRVRPESNVARWSRRGTWQRVSHSHSATTREPLQGARHKKEAHGRMAYGREGVLYQVRNLHSGLNRL